MCIIKKQARDKPRSEIISNFEHTLRGFKLLRTYLKELDFSSIATRKFNQNSLEKSFSQI